VPLQACVSLPLKPWLDPIVVSGSLHVYIWQSARGEVVIGGATDPYGLYANRSTLEFAEGTLLQREETGGQQVAIEATAGADAIDTPLLLLTNFGTAAGAELFAASLTGAARAESVGQRTAGRVSLQKLIPLADGSGLWLSWARYLQASGDALHRTGVEPDIEVDVPSVELGEPWPPGDPILERALEHLQAAAPAVAAAA
jgi:C-terminal processing protease CtpA/Prc